MDPLWSETCWGTFKYFIILIVSTYYILCISWIIKCLTILSCSEIYNCRAKSKLLSCGIWCRVASFRKNLLASSCPSLSLYPATYQHAAYSPHLKLCTAAFSDSLVNIYQITRCHLPYERNLNTSYNKKLKYRLRFKKKICSKVLPSVF